MFLQFIPVQLPVLLIVDGHKSHVTEELINCAVENKVVVFCLPAQPLDLFMFGPFKKRGWVKACAAFNHLTSVVVNQRNFAKIFNVAWHSSIRPEVIISGFRKSGIYPYNPAMFDYSKLSTSQKQQQQQRLPQQQQQQPPQQQPKQQQPPQQQQPPTLQQPTAQQQVPSQLQLLCSSQQPHCHHLYQTLHFKQI